jgi:hypothetical protein
MRIPPGISPQRDDGAQEGRKGECRIGEMEYRKQNTGVAGVQELQELEGRMQNTEYRSQNTGVRTLRGQYGH